MPVYTPHGLAIHLDTPTAFGFMARLYPKVTPHRVLTTVEATVNVLPMFSFIVGLIAFGLRLEPFEIGAVVTIAGLLALFLVASNLVFYVPGLIAVARLFNVVFGCGVLGVGLNIAVIASVGMILTGWQGVVGYVAGRLICGFIGRDILACLMWFSKRKRGFVLPQTERIFFNVFKYYAKKLKVKKNLELSNEEKEFDRWDCAFMDYAGDTVSFAGHLLDWDEYHTLKRQNRLRKSSHTTTFDADIIQREFQEEEDEEDFGDLLQDDLDGAAKGDAESQDNLALRYAEGDGVEQNDAKAAKWWTKAAAQGHVNAQYNLGVIYISGEGVERDLVEAYKWFGLAIAQGDRHSIEEFQSLEKSMTTEQIAQARRLIQEFRPSRE